MKYTTLVLGKMYRKMRCETIPESHYKRVGEMSDMLQQRQDAGELQRTDELKSPAEILICKITLSLPQVVFLLYFSEL